jgi:hypothetical protein
MGETILSPLPRGRGLPRLSPQGFRRGRVRGTAVGKRAGVDTALKRRDAPSPTPLMAALRSTKATLPSPPCGGEG